MLVFVGCWGVAVAGHAVAGTLLELVRARFGAVSMGGGGGQVLAACSIGCGLGVKAEEVAEVRCALVCLRWSVDARGPDRCVVVCDVCGAGGGTRVDGTARCAARRCERGADKKTDESLREGLLRLAQIQGGSVCVL